MKGFICNSNALFSKTESLMKVNHYKCEMKQNFKVKFYPENILKITGTITKLLDFDYGTL